MTHWTTVVLLAQVACAGGLVLLATAHAHTSYWLRLLPALVLIGAGITVVAVALNMAAGKDVAAEDKGVAYGLFETSTHVSGAIVVALLATVAAAGMRDAGGSAEAAAAAGYRLALFVAAGAAVGGGVLAVLLGRRSRDSARTSAGTAVSAPPTETEGVTSAQRGIT
jgi:MFS family permease